MLEMSVEQEIQTMLKQYADHKNDIAIYKVLLGGAGIEEKERTEFARSKEKLEKQNELVRGLVDALPSLESRVIRLHFLDEYGNNKTIKEIADALNISIGRVKKEQLRAIKRLQDILNLKGE